MSKLLLLLFLLFLLLLLLLLQSTYLPTYLFTSAKVEPS